MGILVAIILVTLQLMAALAHSTGLIYLSLLTGAMPLTLDSNKDLAIASPFGRLDVNAMRLFGLWIGASLVFLFHLDRAWRYFSEYGYHIAFLVFCCLGFFWAPSLAYGLRMFLKLSAPFLFLLLILVAVESQRQLTAIRRVILCSGFLVFAAAIVLQLAGIQSSLDHRLTIPATSAAGFSAHLVAVAILALAGMMYDNRTRNGLLVLCLTVGTLLAVTRITTAALFVGFSVVLYLGLRGVPRYVLPVGGVIALPALFLFNETFRERMFFSGKSMSAGQILQDPNGALGNVRGSGRFAAWQSVFDQFVVPSPWIGSGTGATQHYYYTHSVTGLGAIHSDYLRLLAEVGIIGTFLFLLAMIAYLYRMIRTYRETPQSEAGRYALAGTAALAAYLVVMATDNAFDYVNLLGIYVFSFIAMSEKAKELQDAEVSLPEALPDDVSEPVASEKAYVTHPRYPIIS